jgi:hypothetical protein
MSDGKLAIIAGLIVLKHFEPDTYGKISLGFDDYEVVIDLLLPASADGGEFLQNCWRFASNSLNSEAEDYKETKRSFDVHTRVHEGDYIAKLKKNYVDSFTVSDA